MVKKEYFINKEKFDELYPCVEELHSNISVMKAFCEKYEKEGELYKVLPILKTIYTQSDILYSEFINLEADGKI